jgi:hypothetical protein
MTIRVGALGASRRFPVKLSYVQPTRGKLEMKLLSSGAAALIAAATIVLGGCAAEQPKPEQQAQASPCTGVAPPTGTMLRRKEDCGGSRAEGGLSQDVIDQIRRDQMNNTSRPRGLGGGG